MIKTTSHIYMDYNRMIRQAEALETVAARLESATQRELSGYGYDASFWKGDAGDEFRVKVRKLDDNLKKRAKELRKAAKGIRTAAEREKRLELSIAASLGI